jgi:hypothetical protein
VPDKLLEIVARSIHEDYVERSRSEGKEPSSNPSLLPWDELPETLRNSNREQAEDIENKLAVISCEIASKDDDRPPVAEFSEAEVEMLAKLEHARWEAERRADGWTYGPIKDLNGKHSPYLVPWEDLTEEVRDLDRNTVRRIPRFLHNVDLVVIRTFGTKV